MVLLALAGNAIQLVPDGTLLFHLAVIAVMVALLNATLLILASLSERLLEYESRLREARAEGYVLLEEERAAVSRERERKVAEIKVEVATWLHEQKEKLRIDAEQIRATLEKDAKTMALEIARQILRREVNQ